MILPQKHITISESMFGFGGQVVSLINKKITVDELWDKYNSSNISSYKHGFDSFILVLDYLFIIGAIVFDDGGCINLATH